VTLRHDRWMRPSCEIRRYAPLGSLPGARLQLA